MKKYIIFTLLSFCLLSCQDNLEPEVFSRLSTSNFPKTESDFEVYVNGIYGEFRGDGAWGRYSIDPVSRLMLGEFGTEECSISWDWANNPQKTFNFNPYYDMFVHLYTQMVPAVTRATAAIEILKGADLADESLKSRFIAEVQACRGLWLYDLEGFYGPPAVVLDAEAALNPQELYFPPRLSPEEYLKFVETDLLDAMDNLPVSYGSSSDFGRFTKGAVATILLKFYMRHKEFEKAVNMSEQIMSMGYGLESDYSSIWNIGNEQNGEVIFALSAFSSPHPTANIWRAHVLPGDWVSPTGAAVVAWGGYRLPWSVYDQFDTQDSRRKTMVKDYLVNINGTVQLVDGRADGRLNAWNPGAVPLKYSEDPSSDGLFTGNDIVLLRYADVLLLRAEALNEVNGPNQESINLINQVRSRAFNGDASKLASLANFSDIQSMRDYLLLERLFEFCYEGERREDLIRHGKYIEFAQSRGANAQSFHVRYPLPGGWIIAAEGNLDQNIGY